MQLAVTMHWLPLILPALACCLPMQTGLMATVFDLQRPAEQWGVGGTPLVSMMALEIKGGK